MHDPSNPLDELLPGLRSQQPELSITGPIHPRLISFEITGAFHWALIIWKQPDSGKTLYTALCQALEAAWLVNVSSPIADPPPQPHSVMLFFFEVPSLETQRAAQALGFNAADVDLGRSALPRLRREALLVGREVEAPSAMWQLKVSLGDTPEQTQQIAKLDQAITSACQTETWGENPGAMAHALITCALPHWPADAYLDALDNLETKLSQHNVGQMRFWPSAVFQAMCDLIALAAHRNLHIEVAWGSTEPDELGRHGPPILRVHTTDHRDYHIPLGLHALRWWCMPLAAGEEVPSMRSWLLHQFEVKS